jgi:hypothetical protein
MKELIALLQKYDPSTTVSEVLDDLSANNYPNPDLDSTNDHTEDDSTNPDKPRDPRP